MNLWLCTLSLIPLVDAWTFLYTNSTGNATILHDTGTDNCTSIDLAGGKFFSWDPEDSGLCISIYYDSSCKERGGLSCNAWSKNASTTFHGVQIYSESDSSSASVSTSTPTPTTSASSSTSTSTSTSTTLSTSTPTTPTSTATSTNSATAGSGSSSSISGGAIAGIVIGVVAAVAIIGGLFFYFGRRNRKNASTPAGNQQSGPASGSMPGEPHGPYSPQAPMLVAGYAQPPYTDNSDKAPNSSSGMSSVRPAPGSRVVELAGHDRAVELGNSPISELDGQTSEKYSYRF
ncbi:uncharacterized protein N7473_010713 [Penicillium subrubescens]|uniref:Mid2 domain-containing protein n=1 Tax=Penicillium subrubescens TaxID=1316194 RepID=A0A1Q5T2U9_9EURO|nr:uncharacterized protein N7473_010713 [Penicillium subrubescens]KAJ5883827.1 hypothetical protein N7473_010713 [Penicillium subrubescens]OKO94568.1 hypothetical protein PENSUB_11835 [Penicillium subrubescens]